MLRMKCALLVQEQGRLMISIEIADPAYTAVEFTLKDDATNIW